MANIREARRALIARILEGAGRMSTSERRKAFDNSGLEGPAGVLAGKVATCAYKITDEDVAAARAAGLEEGAIFELVVCAAVGQASRQYDSAMAALEAAGGAK